MFFFLPCFYLLPLFLFPFLFLSVAAPFFLCSSLTSFHFLFASIMLSSSCCFSTVFLVSVFSLSCWFMRFPLLLLFAVQKNDHAVKQKHKTQGRFYEGSNLQNFRVLAEEKRHGREHSWVLEKTMNMCTWMPACFYRIYRHLWSQLYRSVLMSVVCRCYIYVCFLPVAFPGNLFESMFLIRGCSCVCALVCTVRRLNCGTLSKTTLRLSGFYIFYVYKQI